MYSTQALSEGRTMVFVSNISSVVKEANSVAGFGLDPQFAETLSELLSRCRAAGLDFRISQGLRTPQKQAEYYCKWVRRSPADSLGSRRF